MTSKSSSWASPATGHPVRFLTASPQRADCRQPGLAQPIEHRRQRAELQVVELDRLAGRQLAGAASVLVRELADHAQLLGRHPARGQLDPEHEGADLRLVVVEAPPLEPDEILLLDVGVARRDQRRQLTHHREWALLPLQALDGIALEHELQRRGLPSRLWWCPLPCSASVPETRRGPDPGALDGADGTCASPSSRWPPRVGGSRLEFAPDGRLVPVAAVSAGQVPIPLVMADAIECIAMSLQKYKCRESK